MAIKINFIVIIYSIFVTGFQVLQRRWRFVMITKVKPEEMIGKATVVVWTIGAAMAKIVAEKKLEEVNGLRAEMIKTLPPLTITLLILF
jgi:hypothetical protein